ncbi:MAG: glycosyltransferase family 9 protein [Candidatus Omnitrophica bacterium]|nr:glycosyltransferase family 9 protein [Candidatus Omnitrophota bacterium]
MKLKIIKIIDFYLGNLLIVIFKPLTIILGHILPINHSLTIKNKITVIKILGGGSLVIALPALLGLRKKFPDVRISLVTMKDVAPFAQTLNIFDEILEIDSSTISSFTLSGIKAYLKTFKTDTIVDLEVHSRISTIFSLLTCARNRIGFYRESAFWRKGISTHLLYFNVFSGAYHFYDKAFGLFSVSPCSTLECKDHLTASWPKVKKEKYQICIGHACSDFSPERMLTAEQWKTIFLRKLAKHAGAEIIFLGSGKDKPLAENIIAAVTSDFPSCTFSNLCGKTSLKESLSVLYSSDEFWGVDSALLHYARIFRIKSSSWWGPTDPQTRLRPIEGLLEEVYYKKIPCSPCVHVTETPPCRGDNICIQNLFNEEQKDWIPLVWKS